MKKNNFSVKVLIFWIIALFITSTLNPIILGSDSKKQSNLLKNGEAISHDSISIERDKGTDDGFVYVDNDAAHSWYDHTHVRTVQEGINNASVGDTVFVYNGIYYENVIADKSIILKGEDRDNTIIDANGVGSAIALATNNGVNLSGFTMQNSGNYQYGDSGLQVGKWGVDSDYNIIFGNKMINNFAGIYMEGSTHNIIYDNMMMNNSYLGLYMRSSDHYNTIFNNTITGNQASGAYAFSCSNNNFYDNMIIYNGGNGISFSECSGNNIFKNYISNNDRGIFVGDRSGNHQIYENIISDNLIGGVYLESGSYGTWVYHNNFINNNQNAEDHASFSKNFDEGDQSGGNYWDDYTASDLNHDGIGDKPYNISGGSNQDRYPLIYEWGENRPVANFSYIINNFTVMFNATSSYDRDGTIVWYYWDFGDGKNDTGLFSLHNYMQYGQYLVLLTISDNDGHQQNHTEVINVAGINDPPISPTITGPQILIKNVEYTYHFVTIDPNANDIYYYIDWGDNSSSGWLGPYPSGTEISVNHTWTTMSTFLLQAKSMDIFNAESQWINMSVSTESGLMIKTGFGQYSDGDFIPYSVHFPLRPYVVTCSQSIASGKPVMSCPINVTTDGFYLAIIDYTGARVQNAQVFWIAMYPNEYTNSQGLAIETGYGKYNDHTTVYFNHNFLGVPVVITNANLNGVPIISNVKNPVSSNFIILLNNNNNQPVNNAMVYWIAIYPGQYIDLHSHLMIESRCTYIRNNVFVQYNLQFPSAPNVVTNAQNSLAATISYPINTSNNGFTISLLKYQGSPGDTAWVSWISIYPDTYDGMTPDIPNKPNGPDLDNPGSLCNFSTTTNDPFNEPVKYGWDWNGDETVDEWTDFYPSGSTVNISHSWGFSGIYNVKVKAENIDGRKSDFSPIKIITITNPPYTPSNPIPDNNAIEISIYAPLKWFGDDPDPFDYVTYDVYFGKTNPPIKVVNNQSSKIYEPETMELNTTYYWQIVTWDNHGASAIGPIWHFKTEIVPSPENWPMFHHDKTHIGYSTTVAPSYINSVWYYPTGSISFSSPAVINDKIYIGSYNNKLYCLDSRNGSLLWSYTTGSHIESSPAVWEDKVYFGSYDGNVYCLNANNGSFIWSYTTGGSIVFSSPVIYENKLYIGSMDAKLYCLNALNGSYIWSIQTVWRIRSSPAVVNGIVYIAEEAGFVRALNAENGYQFWATQIGTTILSSPTVINNRVYIGSDDWKIYCLNATNGVVVWTYSTDDGVWSTPAVAYGNVYVGSEDNKMYCLDAEGNDDGTTNLIWSFSTLGPWIVSSPAVADYKVYFGSYDRNVYCLDALNGTVLWNFTTGNFILSSPAIVDGKVYIGSEDGNLYIFSSENEPPFIPSDPSPENGSIASIDTELSWVGGDPGPYDTVTYDVYFGTATPPPQVSWNQSSTLFNPGFLDPDTTYYWQIIARDSHNAATVGPLWFFTTNINIVYVDDNADPSWYDATHVRTIQEGINNATSGSMVFVNAGRYDENIDVNKTLSLRGEDKETTVIDGKNGFTVILITAPFVNISEFTIQNTGNSSGIGIWLRSNHSNISSNKIMSNEYAGVWSYSSNSTISENFIIENGHGIVFKDSYFNNDNIISDNNISSNYGWAIYLSQANRNRIFRNTFQSNDCGIRIWSSKNNVIYHNNFIGNNQNAYDDSNNPWNAWDNGYPSGGNYWSDYNGTDTNHDGFGDTPYNISGKNPPNQDRYPFIYQNGWIPNNPPYNPSNPNPPLGAASVDINVNLSWIGGDPNPEDTVTYDVYFGTTNPPPKIISRQTNTTYNPGLLYYSTTYYWKIISWDIHGASTSGPVWRFTTFPTPSSIVAWGYNYDGQCNVPEPNTGFIAADGGRSHSLGLKSNGSIIAWGNNLYHQCSVPFPNTGFIAVAAGFYHSLGLKADGSIVAWGWNGNGQCNVPAPNTDFIAVAAGYTHSLGLKADGSIVAWGSNNNGQCNVPEPNTGFIAVDGGSSHSLGLKDDGSIVAWGSNDHGQCNLPTPNTNFTAISTCNYHNLGLKANGSVVAWGSNNYGQCNVPEPNTNFIAVSAGWEHSLGLKSDESIVGWGKNNYGQSYVPPPNTNFVIIATGYNHNLCIRQNSPPYIPSNPYPSSNATNISVNTLLNWIGGDSDPNDIVTYDVYFGTNNPPPKIVSNQTGTSYDPGTINYNITYYWKITAWDNHGASTAGPIWSYTTVTKPPAPAQPVDITAWHIYTADLYKGIGGYPGRYNGQPYTYQSNSTETSSDLYFTFYWDEDNITVVGPVSDSASATHTYGQWGTYNITVTVKHGTDGTPSESSVARSVRMYKAGDVNLDNRVTFADIDPFVETLSGHLAYVTAHPDGYWFTADCNQDGNVTFADIDPFVALLGTK